MTGTDQPTGRAHPDRVTLRAVQREALRTLLQALVPANAFYREKLARAGWAERLPASLDEYAERFPFTLKSEIVADQLAHPPYGTNLTFPLARYTRCHQTSGTTGTPLRWLDTPENWDRLVEGWMEVQRAAGVTAADRLFFAFSFGPFIGFWMAFEAASRLGALCVPGGGLSSSARLQAILDHRITVLCCTPTYALHLAEVAATEQIPLSRAVVRTLIVAGEPGGSLPAIRRRLEALWNGARVFDHHGMTEVGPVTYECPCTPGRLHVMESTHLAEILDPQTGRPVREGERGELVLTTLTRTGSPLLRYRTGDWVEPVFAPSNLEAPACACGRHELALRGGILGRVDDMVIVRGVNIYPAAVDDVVRRIPEVAEYQVLVTAIEGLAEMTLRVEPGPDCADLGGMVRRLAQALQVAFSLRIPVIPVAPGSLPRFELKARRWVRS